MAAAKSLVKQINRTMCCSTARKRVVILGTGWGSYSLLRNIKKRDIDVIVISPRNHFLFTPLLASTTVGTLEFRSIIEPIRNAGFRDEHHFHLSYATNIDLHNNTVECTSALDDGVKYSVPYDMLVIGVGAIPNTFGIEGVNENAFFLKEIQDARIIRNKILTNFELATQPSVSEEERRRLLHFVIVGGGPTGVEFGAEFYDFLKQDLERLYPYECNTVQITLIEANEILSSFDTKLRSYTEHLIKKRSRMKILKASVTKLTNTSISINGKSDIPVGMVVWSTGLAPREFVRNLSLEKNNQGQILVDDHLRAVSVSRGNVFVLGDCACILENPLPCTAQVAERQGRYLARVLSHTHHTDFDTFVYKPMGMLAYVGGYKAVTDTPVAKSQGFSSWLLWRSAYATKLGSWRLRMQVPVDWTKSFFFGRDTSRF